MRLRLLGVEPAAADQVFARLSASGGIRVWRNADRSGELISTLGGSKTWDLYSESGDMPQTVYVEGITSGAASLTFTLVAEAFDPDPADTVVFSVVAPDIDILGAEGVELADDVEMMPGGFVQLNNDDDDEDGVVDMEDEVVASGDDDFVVLRLQAVAAGGTYTLTFPTEKLRIWKNADRTDEVISGSSEFDASQVTHVYAEGTEWPNGPSAEQIDLAYRYEGYEFADVDSVMIHVVELEFVAYNSQTGEVYVPDEIAAGDARPEVTLTVAHTEITADGKLQVTVQGTVWDRLSELAHDAADRVQQLNFFVNSQHAGAIDDLPSLAGSGGTPWTPHPFLITFERTFVLDEPAGTYIIRAQTTPNAADVEGWDVVGVRVEYQDVTSSFPGIDLQQLWLDTPPEVNPQTGLPLQSRRYLSPPTFPPGSYITHPAAGEDPQIWAPVEIKTQELPGSLPGSLEPLMLRIDGLDESTVEYVSLALDGQDQQVAPFTSSPKKFYVVDDYPGSPRRIYVVTPRQMTPELEECRGGTLDIAQNGGKLVARMRTTNGQPVVIDATVNVLAHDLGDAPKTHWWQSDHTTMEQMLSWFEVLYGDTGLKMLEYYLEGGNTIDLDNVFGNHDTDGWISGNGYLEIEIEEDIHPITAAQYLWVELRECLPYYEAQMLAAQHMDPDTLEEAMHQTAAGAAEIAAAGAQVYLAGISILSEGADFVMTFNEVSEGNYVAAFGFLPWIPASAFKGGKVLLKLPGGHVLGEFTEAAVDALRAAAKIDANDLAGRFAKIAPLDLPLETRMALVKAGFLKAPTNRGKLASNLIDAGHPRPSTFHQAHHELPWTYNDWFAAHGLDVNDADYGKWVLGNVGGGRHQSWSYEYNQEWDSFIRPDGENCVTYTRAEIIAKLEELRGLYGDYYE